MAPATGSGAPPLRRVIAVAPNASVDRILSVERLAPGEIHRPQVLSAVPGGKALNLARAAVRLGLRARVVTVLAGHAGAWIEDGLRAEGIGARTVRVAGETRQCLSLLDRSTGALTELYEPGPAVDGHAWAALEAALATELGEEPEAAVVAVSGSLPAGAPADGHARLVRLAAAAGARAVVDAGGASLAAAAGAGAWLAKGNAAEAAAATTDGRAAALAATAPETDGEAEALAAARALRALGATTVLVSRGTLGSLLVDEAGAAWRVGPPPELGAFPVGSGDALLGGLLAALAEGDSLPDAARRGSAAAAANALRPGQGVLDPADAARLLPGITLERLDG